MTVADLLVIGGAPGAGKSTLSARLQHALGSPFLEFSVLRQPHLDPLWSNESPAEEAMAFENLLFVLENYLAHGYRDVIVTDLKDFRLGDLAAAFPDARTFTLVLRDPEELRRRIESRAAGWRDAEGAGAWNGAVRARAPFPGETKIEADGLSPDDLAAIVTGEGG